MRQILERRAVRAEDDLLLDDIQRRTHQFFVVNSNPLTLDQDAPYAPASVAGCGFALTDFCIAASRGWMTREDGARRCLAIMKTLLDAPQGPELEGRSGIRGAYYHFVHPQLGTRACQPEFWPQLRQFFKVMPERVEVEVSFMDTALFVAGALCCRNTFDGWSPLERLVRQTATRIYERVEWDWMLGDDNLLRMGWKPETGMLEARFVGLTEALLLYILAIGSPTHPITPKAWRAQLAGIKAEPSFGETFAKMLDSPQFGYQYPACFIDWRGLFDQICRELGFDWFENAVRETRAQYNYALLNPLHHAGYGPTVWGLTASNSPEGYGVHGIGGPDNGTVAPTAVAASYPFAPDLVLATLRDWNVNRPELLGETGFFDAFNPGADRSKPSGWVDDRQIAIDQGPIQAMLENGRRGTVWRAMSKDADLRRGLRRAGFTGGWLNSHSFSEIALALAGAVRSWLVASKNQGRRAGL